MNQCIRLIQSLYKFSKIRPIKEVKQATVGIVSIIGNLRSGMSNYLNMRQPYLESDFAASNAMPISYDSDLENFWTQKSKNKIIFPSFFWH